MDMLQAEQITDLLNMQNGLPALVPTDVYAKRNHLLFHSDGQVTCSICVERVSWYQMEIKWLTVRPDCKRKGWGRSMLMAAEARAKKRGASVIQCTVRADNLPSNCLFLALGYFPAATFKNPESGNTLHIYQKVL
jgi:ribosomal protein S18 acetylase RimI-like enzyme